MEASIHACAMIVLMMGTVALVVRALRRPLPPHVDMGVIAPLAVAGILVYGLLSALLFRGHGFLPL